MQEGWLKTADGGDGLSLQAGGRWDVESAARLDSELNDIVGRARRAVTVDMAAVQRLDTAGAWLIHRTLKQLSEGGVAATLGAVKPQHQAMLDQVAANDHPCEVEPPAVGSLTAVLAHLGEGAMDALNEGRQVIAFLGIVVATMARLVRHPSRLRATALVYHMEQVGLNALPIVGLISILVGVVLAYQGAVQLQRFGAEVFVVNLIGISTLREIAILLTAIVVAGRSGSAFAASIGSMMVHEEVDAMRTLGLDPIEVLVLPRVLALVIMLPVLAFFADLMGLLGGGLLSWLALDLSPALYVARLNDAVGLWHLWVGIIKAPFFGFLIGLVGCLEGFRVTGSAESVGQQTTKAVVTSIFLVIIMDAVFSIFFSVIGI